VYDEYESKFDEKSSKITTIPTEQKQLKESAGIW
jgi:hypothetical protein